MNDYFGFADICFRLVPDDPSSRLAIAAVPRTRVKCRRGGARVTTEVVVPMRTGREELANCGSIGAAEQAGCKVRR